MFFFGACERDNGKNAKKNGDGNWKFDMKANMSTASTHTIKKNDEKHKYNERFPNFLY